MPELPDLEVFSKNLSKILKGATMEKISITANTALSAPKSKFNILNGQKLIRIFREGKELRLAFSQDVVGIHLMLHGKLYWMEKSPEKYTLATLTFDNGYVLGIADYQRRARLSLNPEETEVPDAMDKQAGIAFWKEVLGGKATIKNVLLDQKVVRGIGNAYADEILWAARISPFSVANRIPPAAVKRLQTAVRKVLSSAVKAVDKAAPGIIGGEVRSFLAIHNAKKKQSPGGAKIEHTTKSGRITYFTEEQELFE